MRLGYFAAGGTLIAVGWGLGVIGNGVAHLEAPSGGFRFYSWTIGRSMGPYAWALLGLGLLVGAFGLVLLLLGRGSPKGAFVLPGYDYGRPPDRDGPRPD